MTFEGYWVVLSQNNTHRPILESLARSAADARKKFLAHAADMNWGSYTWNQWEADHGYSIWCVNAGSHNPKDPT